MRTSKRLLGITSLFLSLITTTALAQNRPRVGEINPADREKYRTRYEAKNSTTFSFGPAVASNLNDTKMLYDLGLGYEWEVGSQGGVIAELTGAFGSSTAFVDGIIGGKFYFSDGDVSPMIKGGFGFGAAKGPDLDSAQGFAAEIGLGVTLFRTSTVHLEVAADYHFLFASNDKGNPGLGALNLTLHF